VGERVRIVGGTFRGRTIVAPKGTATRPTTDRTRESLFNILEHGLGGCAPNGEGARVLDLFAGSGAMGLEALSRGAAFALFVDEAAATRGAIRENVEALGLQGATKIFRRDATKLGPLPANVGEPFGLVFCDPPYGKGLGEQAVASARDGGWLINGALILLEEAKGAFVAPDGFEELDRRAFGDTEVTFLKAL
jgi:16S rRNA (guanine966-N2)-methyltransferase